MKAGGKERTGLGISDGNLGRGVVSLFEVSSNAHGTDGASEILTRGELAHQHRLKKKSFATHGGPIEVPTV